MKISEEEKGHYSKNKCFQTNVKLQIKKKNKTPMPKHIYSQGLLEDGEKKTLESTKREVTHYTGN